MVNHLLVTLNKTYLPYTNQSGVFDPVSYSLFQFAASVKVTTPLVHFITQQSHAYSVEVLIVSRAEARRKQFVYSPLVYYQLL